MSRGGDGKGLDPPDQPRTQNDDAPRRPIAHTAVIERHEASYVPAVGLEPTTLGL